MRATPPSSVHSAQHARENLKLGTQCCLHTITGMYPPDGPISLADSRVHEALLHSYDSAGAILLHAHAQTHTHTHTTCTHIPPFSFIHYIHTFTFTQCLINSVCPVLSWLCPSPSRWTSQPTLMSSKRVM